MSSELNVKSVKLLFIKQLIVGDHFTDKDFIEWDLVFTLPYVDCEVAIFNPRL